MADSDWQGDLAVEKPASSKKLWCEKCQKKQPCAVTLCQYERPNVELSYQKIVCGWCGSEIAKI